MHSRFLSVPRWTPLDLREPYSINQHLLVVHRFITQRRRWPSPFLLFSLPFRRLFVRIVASSSFVVANNHGSAAARTEPKLQSVNTHTHTRLRLPPLPRKVLIISKTSQTQPIYYHLIQTDPNIRPVCCHTARSIHYISCDRSESRPTIQPIP